MHVKFHGNSNIKNNRLISLKTTNVNITVMLDDETGDNPPNSC